MCECVIQFKLGKLASETSNSYSAHSKHEEENISFSNWLPYGNRQSFKDFSEKCLLFGTY